MKLIMNNEMINSKLEIAGKVTSAPIFYHETYGEKFLTFTIECPRLSESVDDIPVMISEKILGGIKVGDYLNINGQLRTYNKYEEDKSRLLIFAFVRDVAIISEEEFKSIKNPNILEMTGFICKEPAYRTTPLGREITDILIAVNRAFKKSDYIPVITWGRNAKFASLLDVGTKVKVTGRLQSRSYEKKVDADTKVTRIAYEVSATQIVEVAVTEEKATEV
jgi:primosomal replication protein N